MMTKRRMKKCKNLLAYIVLSIACVIVLFPFLVILSTSFKSMSEAQSLPVSLIPKEFTVEAYVSAFSDKRIYKGLLNTLIVVCPVMIVGVLVSSLAAYAFAKINFKGRSALFALILGSMMLPGVITMTPAYVIYDYIGWTDTWLPLMIPGMFGTASCIFFMRQFISKIPGEVIESAMVDGVGHFGIFVRIILPMIIPAVVAQVVLWFFAGYNDYFGPMLYLNTQDNYTLQLVLQNIAAQADANMPKVMATCVISLIPALIIYGFAQKSLLKGIALEGIRK